MGRTSVPGIFASGDAVKGARTVVEAVAYSKKVAEAMHEYMQTLPPDPPDPYAGGARGEPTTTATEPTAPRKRREGGQP